MQTIGNALTLLKRQAALESAMKQPGGIRITEEQELHTLRQRLNAFPEALQAILQAANALRRPISKISAHDVEACATAEPAA
jgi:hypothetical protein